jgi:hypothetical protein
LLNSCLEEPSAATAFAQPFLTFRSSESGEIHNQSQFLVVTWISIYIQSMLALIYKQNTMGAKCRYILFYLFSANKSKALVLDSRKKLSANLEWIT